MDSKIYNKLVNISDVMQYLSFSDISLQVHSCCCKSHKFPSFLWFSSIPFHIYIYIAAAERSYPGPDIRGGGREELLRVGGRGGGREELLHARGKEQWLHFAGAGVKRDPASKVRETQVRR